MQLVLVSCIKFLFLYPWLLQPPVSHGRESRGLDCSSPAQCWCGDFRSCSGSLRPSHLREDHKLSCAESGRSEHCWWGRIQSWPQLDSQWGSCRSPQGPWGSRGVPREGSTTPGAAETGEGLSHSVGFGATLHSRQSADQGRTGLEQVREDKTAQTHSTG